ncbi:restriction endonuclease [Carnobacterium maltaromaticum]|nr:restriction endonuclease [Carnobacterium maltaromaticum]TFJ72430.1 restriction endonuclease [Carnobacterium maltaromaticum]TFJ77342.1 restriction endonuclease [Carnobacterium maltaromaticum]
MIYETEDELLVKAKQANGKTFGEIDKTGRILNGKNKGGLGHIVEEGFFGYEINSDARPDFENLNIELKVTPIKVNKNKSISAKERLVLNIIDYMKEPQNDFTTSSFWKKNEKILMMFYQWFPEIERKDYKILGSILHQYSENDLLILKKDWETIVSKINLGKAHELSEGDTMYLGACTKGANKNSLREQPFSDIPAMQRAYSLKQSYMTALVRSIFDGEVLTRIATPDELKEKSIEEIVAEKFNPFIGMTDDEIAKELEIQVDKKNKSYIPLMISALLGIKGTKLDKIEEFSKANIKFKTVRLEPNGKPKESMSFEKINFDEWLDESWEESKIYKQFEKTKFLFIVFEYKETLKENSKRKLYFKGFKLWNMPEEIINSKVKELWDEVRKITREGVQIEYRTYGEKVREINNLPKLHFNGVVHIRPKAKDGNDKVALPDGQKITKQCYWLNNSYIAEILKEII